MDMNDYEEAFGLDGSPSDSEKATPKYEKALEKAHEIRQFEIELYWKRATYFWTFIALSLGGYLTILSSGKICPPDKPNLLLTASSFGVVFSFAWYLVNRASKSWQENWEHHVDLLEDKVTGPLHKTILNDTSKALWPLWGPYPFSTSKINSILSLYVLSIFLYLWINEIKAFYSQLLSKSSDWHGLIVIALTVITLGFLSKTGKKWPITAKVVSAKKRRKTIE